MAPSYDPCESMASTGAARHALHGCGLLKGQQVDPWRELEDALHALTHCQQAISTKAFPSTD